MNENVKVELSKGVFLEGSYDEVKNILRTKERVNNV